MNNETKKKLEKLAAQQFLNIYNGKIGSYYEIYEINEAPDIRCIDNKSGLKFDLEITGHENIKGDYKKFVENIDFGIPSFEDFPLGDSRGQRGNIDLILENFIHILEYKLLAKYEGTPTALIIWRTSMIWSCDQLAIEISERVNELLIGKEEHYPKGIWFFCNRNETTGIDIINLSTLKPSRFL